MTPVVKSPINHGIAINYFHSNRIKTTPVNRTYNVPMHHFDPINSFNKRLLHDIFHIGPGISPTANQHIATKYVISGIIKCHYTFVHVR